MVRPATLVSRAAAASVVVGAFLIPFGSAHADETLTVTTPYPSVETQPGSTVKFDITLTSATPDPVRLAVDGVTDGWTATMRGGGFVVHEVTAQPDNGAKATLEVDVPSDATAGNHDLSVVATDATGTSRTLGLQLVVAEQVDNGISLTADFPSLSGDPGGTFAYTLTIDNETPEQQTFTFDPTAPQGWSVTASPTAESKAQTLTIDAGATSDLKVTATAPDSAEQGQYPIDVAVVGANGASGKLTLEADVVGTPKLGLGTADERLDVTGSANQAHRIPMIVSNTGTAVLDSVKLAGTAPTGWDVSFDPQTVDAVQPGETAQVTAIVTPSSNAVAGDYAMTVRASAGSLSQNVDLRYTVEGSRTLGFIAVGVIALAFLALAGVFVKFGRR